MKLAVIGSRSLTNEELVASKLAEVDFEVLVSGGAKGADTLAENYVDRNGKEKLIFLPDYKRYGRYRAPHIRNRLIVDNADRIIAFWDGKSKGTESTIKYARLKSVPIKIIKI